MNGGGGALFPGSPDERFGHQLGRQPSLETGLPTIDTSYSSNPGSAYGSPREEDTISRFGVGLSPNNRALNILDAPLPASFDSNGISHAARYGPWPASVPSKFGLESPSPSLSAVRDGRTSDTLKLLHTSAFGSSEHLSPSVLAQADPSNGLGSSPPVQLPPAATVGSFGFSSAANGSLSGRLGGRPITVGEDFGRQAPARPLHSSLRYSKPRMMSSSVPKIERDWDGELMFEEDYVPDALANEVLTPEEKSRRSSLRLMGSNNSSSVGLNGGEGNSGATATPAVGATKYGSPTLAVSPSRWGPLFQRQREEEQQQIQQQQQQQLHESSNLNNFASGRAMKQAAVSAFGHVGSPLRQSSLAFGDDGSGGGSSRMTGFSGATSEEGSGASRSNSGSMSVLTQQLQRTRLSDDASSSANSRLHPNAASRHSSGGGMGAIGSGAIGKDRDRDRLERHISSGSIGSSNAGRFTTPIDEEDAAFVFSMEEEDDSPSRRKRISGGGLGMGGPWSYAAAAKGANSAAGGLPGSSGGADGNSAPVAGVANP
jgi:hypothetical protein